jgi:PP-loop superfamily ATP-utilizing enzyme
LADDRQEQQQARNHHAPRDGLLFRKGVTVMPNQEVSLPFVRGKVPVVVDIENHPAIAAIARWGQALKEKIEEACFAHYRDKVDSIGPESLPRIRRPREVWKHLEFRHVRIDPNVPDIVVLYVVPAWDEEEHMEWCIRGDDELLYVGQFLQYPVSGYRNLSCGFEAGRADAR